METKICIKCEKELDIEMFTHQMNFKCSRCMVLLKKRKDNLKKKKVLEKMLRERDPVYAKNFFKTWTEIPTDENELINYNNWIQKTVDRLLSVNYYSQQEGKQ